MDLESGWFGKGFVEFFEAVIIGHMGRPEMLHSFLLCDLQLKQQRPEPASMHVARALDRWTREGQYFELLRELSDP